MFFIKKKSSTPHTKEGQEMKQAVTSNVGIAGEERGEDRVLVSMDVVEGSHLRLHTVSGGMKLAWEELLPEERGAIVAAVDKLYWRLLKTMG